MLSGPKAKQRTNKFDPVGVSSDYEGWISEAAHQSLRVGRRRGEEYFVWSNIATKLSNSGLNHSGFIFMNQWSTIAYSHVSPEDRRLQMRPSLNSVPWNSKCVSLRFVTTFSFSQVVKLHFLECCRLWRKCAALFFGGEPFRVCSSCTRYVRSLRIISL